MRVELVYALPHRQELIELDVEVGACVDDVIRASGIEDRFPDDRLHSCAVGVWGRVVSPDYVLKEGDRVELYRPLHMDPRDARRLRAKD